MLKSKRAGARGWRSGKEESNGESRVQLKVRGQDETKEVALEEIVASVEVR